MTNISTSLLPARSSRRHAIGYFSLFLLLVTVACGGPRAAAGPLEGSGRPPGNSGVVEEASTLSAEAPGPAAAVIAPVFPMPLAWAAAPRQRSELLPAVPATNAVAAVILDEASGEVLYDKNAHERLSPASLTKIATLILALESNRLDEWVDVDVDSRLMIGSSIMGLIPGDRFTLRDLLYGLMLPSGNDAALAIGRHLAGSDTAFVAQMNGLMARLGLRDTNFLNPHGLGGPEHYTTAYDLAMLSRYGMTLPGFRDVVTTRSWVAVGQPRTIELSNINTFLNFPGSDGIKTGYTRRAGPTLAASAVRDGHRLYAVVLNSSTRDDDARRLLNWAFTNLSWD